MKHLSRTQKVSQKVISLASAPAGWPVAGSYVVETRRAGDEDLRVIVADWTAAGLRLCASNPRLLDDFAAINNEESLLVFVRRYGSLRSWSLEFSEASLLEPVIWAVRHARLLAGAVRVLEIIEDVRIGRVQINGRAELPDAMASAFQQMGFDGPSDHSGGGHNQFIFEEPAELVQQTRVKRLVEIDDWSRDPIAAGYTLLASFVNPIIKGVYHSLRTPESCPKPYTAGIKGFDLELKSTSLLGVIYWQLMERMCGQLQRCKRCGRAFPKKGRQLYCSASCMNKVKCATFRQKAIQKKNRGMEENDEHCADTGDSKADE